ncbi:Serine phosphatase (fragment) [Candidatus Sulfopaludibacter sp. SbA3]
MSDKLETVTSLELETARDVQNRFLPYRLPRIQGLDYCGDSRPAAGVGGDFFDFVAQGPGGLVVSVGDVSGHGIAAAILMSGMQALLRGLSSGQTYEIARVVGELNRTVYDVSPDNFFATLFYAKVDAGARQLHYVSAGHEPALLVRRSGRGVERLDSTGTVLGLTPRALYAHRTVAFEPGDILIAFTDGVTDAVDGSGGEFRMAGILDVVRQHPGARSSDLVAFIMDAASRFADPVDDRTVVVVRGAADHRCLSSAA